MTHIIDGRKLSKDILVKVKNEIEALPFKPIFCDILVGRDPASVQYVGLKKKKAEEVGIVFYEASFPLDIDTKSLIKEIKKINIIPNMCGVIVQLPLPSHIDQQAVLDAVDISLDVDCLSTVASDNFYKGDLHLGFPTAIACLEVLDSLNLILKDKKIVVIGYGKLVGKPVSALLNFNNLDVQIIRSETKDRENILKEADIIISGIGKGQYIKGTMIKKDAIVIDAGSSEIDSLIVGDVDLNSVLGVASFVSPVPGGVGPVTVAMLLNNVLKVAKGKYDRDY